MKPFAKTIAAHVAYGLLLFFLGLVGSAVLDALAIHGVISDALVVAIVFVPIAILVSKRIGRLSLIGVAVTAVIVAFTSQTIAIEILDWVARPVGGHASWQSFIAKGFGLQFACTTAIVAVAGVAWMLVINRSRAGKTG